MKSFYFFLCLSALYADSFVWTKNFFSKEDVAFLQTIANRSTKETANLITVPEAKNPALLCRVEDLCTAFPEFHAFLQEKVTLFVDQMMGEPYVFFKDKLNFKWPGGGAFPAHQDYPAYALFGPHQHVTVMISIDPATLENGCLHVANNWQGETVLPYIEGGPDHGSIVPDVAQSFEWLPLTTSPCDLVLFNSYVPHYSKPNQSQSSRRALFITYNRASEGRWREAYFHAKRTDPDNPLFHFATPTQARSK